MGIAERYTKNLGAFQEEDLLCIREKRVCVVGCGGLGGYVLEGLARFVVKHLTAIDGDTVQETNWNRQLLSNERNLGENKALAAKEHIMNINSSIDIVAIPEALRKKNSSDFLRNHHIVMDCVDNVRTRFLIQKTCSKMNIPFIHGAISGLYGQVSSVFPEDNSLDIIYNSKNEKGGKLGSVPFTAMLVSAIMCHECVQVLLDSSCKSILRHKLLFIDLAKNIFEEIRL